MNLDILSALSGILGKEPNAPSPDASLPSMPLSMAAPMPQAGPGSMTPTPMPSPLPSGQPPLRGFDMIRELMPLILSAAVGARNPMKGAALAEGYAHGGMLAHQENMVADEKAQHTRELALHFQQQTAQEVLKLKDPIERQRYLQFAHDIGVQHFGLPQNWTQKVPAGTTDELSTLKTELSGKLAAFDKDKKWASVAGTPGEAKISFHLSNGQSIPVSSARRLVGQAMFDATGAQAFAPDSPEGKTEQERAANLLAGIRTARGRGDLKKVAELQASYDDLIKAKRDAATPPRDPNSIEGALLEAYRSGDDAEVKRLLALKRQTGDAGRAAPINITIPGLTGMSPAERVESAADDIINNRMAPSQLATFFTGMGKESASQLRSLVMQRIKQKDPNFNFQVAEANYKYASSNGVQASTRFMTSVQESMPLLLERAKTLQNGNVRFINDLTNMGKNQFNNVDLKRFKVDVTLVADEVAKILQGGGTGNATSDAKLKQATDLLSTSDSPAAIAGALEDINTLIGFRKKAQTEGTFLDKKTPPPAGAKTTIGRFTVQVGGG